MWALSNSVGSAQGIVSSNYGLRIMNIVIQVSNSLELRCNSCEESTLGKSPFLLE